MKSSVLKKRINIIIISVFILWIIISTSITVFKLYPQVYNLQKEGNKKAIENMKKDLDEEIKDIDKLMYRGDIGNKYKLFLNEDEFNIRGFINLKTGESKFNTSNYGECYVDSFKDTLNRIVGVYNFGNGITVGSLKEKIPFMLFLNKVDKNIYQVGVVFLDGKGSFRLDSNGIGKNLKVSFFPIEADTSNFEELNVESGFLGGLYKKNYISDRSFINDVYLKDYKDSVSLELVYDFDTYGTPYVYGAFVRYALAVLIINIIFAFIIIFVLNKSIFFRINSLNNKISSILNNNGVKYRKFTSKQVGILKEDELTSINNDLGLMKDYIDFCSKKAEFYYKKDKVTGLNKIETFIEIGNKFIEDKKQCAIIYINLEGIGVLNYELGFEKSNMLMNNSVRCLRRIMPYGIWSRISTIELAVLFNYSRIDEIDLYCKSMIYALNNNIELNGKQYFISGNIGATLIPEDNKDIEGILSRAYMAMIKARENAINTYKILNYEIQNNVTVDMLQEAMKNSEFKLYYQPKVNCKTGEIVGAEALIRWISPKYGFIPPDKFINVAEKSGYITTLGKWILKEAARNMKRFKEETGKELSVAINVSAIQLLERNFIADVKDIFEKIDYPIENVELEITESMSVNSLSGVSDLIKAARNVGISIAIDDFGTGYSNLKYLKDYKVDTIKLDKSLIENMEDNKKFMESVIDIIKSIGAKSVAEGVEEEKEVYMLRKYSCDIIQGYYFYKPMPLTELIKVMKNGKDKKESNN